MCHGSQQEGDGSRKEKHSDIQNGYSLQILEILGRPVSVLPPLIRDHPRRRLPIYSGTYFNENTHILRCWGDATSKGGILHYTSRQCIYNGLPTTCRKTCPRGPTDISLSHFETVQQIRL
jgi:hypothetical protein